VSIIRVRDLRKHFKVPARKEGRFGSLRTLFSTEHTLRVAVDGVSFDVEAGEVVGYVGPNGAGKSTTIKMLTGILVPSSGEVEVAGLVPHRDRNRHLHHIGVVFGQKTQLWWDVPVVETLRLLKEIYRIPDATYRTNLDLFHDLLGLYDFWNTPVRQLSLGMRMRSDLCAALLHSPDVLFLDEPTIGVDVVAKQKLREFIRTVNQERKVTVLLTTHDMGDIEKLCSRILVIDKGRIIYDGSLNALRDEYDPYRILVVDFAEEVDTADVAAPASEVVSRDGPRVRFRFDRHRVSASDLIVTLAGQHRVRDISVEEPEIEGIIRNIYEGTARPVS
jgi:ABC-2 type transport system ATP-binding protein